MTFVSSKQPLHNRVRFSESKRILNTSTLVYRLMTTVWHLYLFEKIEALDHFKKINGITFCTYVLRKAISRPVSR